MEKISIENQESEKNLQLPLDQIIPSVSMDGLEIDKFGSYTGKIIENSGEGLSREFARTITEQYENYNSFVSNNLSILDDDMYDRSTELFEIVKEGSEFLKELKERFSGKVLVDLGCGQSSSGYKLACILGSKGYVGIDSNGVDIYGIKHLVNSKLDKEKPEKETSDWQPIPYSLVIEDALSFLRRVPDNRVCVSTFGIDGMVMYEASREYVDQSCDEITRVIDPDGAQIANDTGSVLIGSDLEDIRDNDFYTKSRLVFSVHKKG